MTSNLVIITPEITPGAGGVADHTLMLLGSWAKLANVTVLVPKAGFVPSELGEVNSLAATSGQIVTQLPQTNGTVFVQYSAYGFDRFGYPRDLIDALISWKKKNGNARLVILFHEIWAFWRVTNWNFFVQHRHRAALRRLLAVCNEVFTTTESQAEHLRSLSDAAPVHVLPVGSNIQPVGRNDELRQDGVAVLFGTQITRVRALENMGRDLAGLAAAGRIRKIISVGREAESAAREQERRLLERLNLLDGFVQQGPLSPQDVSRLLSTASFGIFGQSELSCTKSGSFMAYAAHQLNVIAHFSDGSKSPPICWLTAPAELFGIDRSELDRRAECLRLWQEQNCSWSVIAHRLGRALEIYP